MANKALIVAVGDYGSFARRLQAPAYEIQQWQRVLGAQPYSFEITPLTDRDATRSRVLEELALLLGGSQPDDQLLFVFMGHGSVTEGRRRGEAEQSLIAYPGTQGLQAAAISESDIEDIFTRIQPPLGVPLTFVLDTCFAANYGDPALFRRDASGSAVGIIPLFAPPPPDLVATAQSLRMFGAFAEQKRGGYETPIILAAAGKTEPAYEIPDDGRRRMLFTMRLLQWLERTRDTYAGIIRNINPLHPDYEQTASLGGNLSRAQEQFPRETIGGPPPPNDPAPNPLRIGRSYVDVDVLGLACFVNAREDNGIWKTRVVMPYDDGQYVGPADRHIAVLEIQARDILQWTGTSPWPYTSGGIEWYRWYLDAHTISVQTGDSSDTFERLPSFSRYVPVMTQICPEVRPRNPRPECFAATPFPGLFAAFLDIPNGNVEAGPLNDRPVTYVRPQTGDVMRAAEYTPISVRVNIPVISAEPTIILRPFPFPNDEALRVTVRSGATILVANAREIDISGDGGGSVPAEQFRLYYKLSSFDPGPNAPLPAGISVPIDDCTVTDWP